MRPARKGKQTSPAFSIVPGDFQRALGHWFEKNGRDLPWRRTRDPYSVLVSELMLQQTQVSTVLSYYKEWFRRFPTVRSLARAGESQVLHAWEGLGYYTRARNLHRAAKLIVRKFSGELPNDPVQLQSLPGVGRYTANAVAVFAFNRSRPIVEANTGRVLARLFNLRQPIDSAAGRTKLWEGAQQIMPARAARKFQAAMMDLGALVCTARNPRCRICPVKKFCRARNPRSLPIKRRRPRTIALTESHAFVSSGDHLLLQKCRGRWRGMWMLPPTVPLSAAPIHVSRFGFTRYTITLQIFRRAGRRANSAEHWFPIHEIGKIAIPSPHRGAINCILAASP